MKKKILSILIVGAALCGCSDTQTATAQKNAAAFFANKTVQQVGAGVIALSLNAGVQALTQEASTGKVNGAQIASDAEYGAAALIRSLQGTASVANPTAITAAINVGSNSSSVSAVITPQVVAAVTQAVNSGVSPAVANENAAAGLEKAASIAAH